SVIPLNDAQRDLVAKHIGLVGVHLRHHPGFLTVAQRRNQWHDLFQEGCMGLIHAATTYGEGNPIPFPAWALLRIHMYVSLAMHRERQADRTTNGLAYLLNNSIRSRGGNSSAETLHTWSGDAIDCGYDSGGRPDTIGDRIREKYDRAAIQAAQLVQ